MPDHHGMATGTSHASILLATGKHQTLVGQGGDDIFVIGAHADAKITETGHGVATVVTSAHDYALPSGINDLIGTGNHVQHLTGNNGNDYIVAGNGNNVIKGGVGNDTIVVGTGANTLTGGVGHDLFVFSKAADHGNMISDFTLGQDELDLTGVMKSINYQGTDPIKDGVLHLVQQGHDTAFVIDPHHDGGAAAHTVVTLANIMPSSLTAGHDFIWH
jgi:Ca2+-binding RTX toxin-like protein